MVNTCTLTLTIDGKEALPIRAIPYLTGWMLIPSYIVDMIVGNRIGLADVLKFYRVDYKRKYHKIDPYEMHRFSSNSDLGYIATEEQRLNAIKALPAGIFAWMDEFTDLIKLTKEMRRTNTSLRIVLLFLEPHVETSIEKLIPEGFEKFNIRRNRNEKTHTRLINSLLKAEKQIRITEPNLTKREFATKLSQMTFNGISYSESYIRAILRKNTI